MAKPAYKSKTIHANVEGTGAAILLVWLLEQFGVKMGPVVAAAAVGVMMGIANVVLRIVTREPIG